MLIRTQGAATLLTGVVACTLVAAVNADCLSNPKLEAVFKDIGGFAEDSTLPAPDSCCQMDICLLPCPAPHPKPSNGFGIAVGLSIAVYCIVGFAAALTIKGKAENFFVGGRTLPLFVVALTLASQSIDANALLGNANLSYKYHTWDGMCLPIGLGLSLCLNSLLFAKKINEGRYLTLPDVIGRAFGPMAELMMSCITIVSFMCLLAGNLVGLAEILSYLWGLEIEGGIFLAGVVMLVYTGAGGLVSVAYSDVVQSLSGFTGAFAVSMYWIRRTDDGSNAKPPVSVGFPGYMYPPGIGEMYNGTACMTDPDALCYNEEHWSDGNGGFTLIDNGAYPFGDKRIFQDEMSEPGALYPFPNAILFNWATIFVLAFGNLAALDFQARCMSAKTPRTAAIGCMIGGFATFVVGIPFAYLGPITRYFYGPDSMYAEFEADTCSKALGLPQCALWLPDSNAFFKFLTEQTPGGLGGWALCGIVAASMSTCDGAILAMATVGAHNIGKKAGVVSVSNLLNIARGLTIPFTVIACLIGSFFKSSHSLGATGYLLVVAFDIALSSCVVPLFGAFGYLGADAAPDAAVAALFGGALTRIILEFSLPKDGFVIAPFGGDEFLDYGPVGSDLVPAWFDHILGDPMDDTLRWNVSAGSDEVGYGECDQKRLEDWTGVDSLVSPAVSLLCFLLVNAYCKYTGGSLLQSMGVPEAWLTPIPAPEEEEDGEEMKPTKVEEMAKEEAL